MPTRCQREGLILRASQFPSTPSHAMVTRSSPSVQDKESESMLSMTTLPPSTSRHSTCDVVIAHKPSVIYCTVRASIQHHLNSIQDCDHIDVPAPPDHHSSSPERCPESAGRFERHTTDRPPGDALRGRQWFRMAPSARHERAKARAADRENCIAVP